MNKSAEITFFVPNPELHMRALSSDGFQEISTKIRLSSWPTRCFKKIHHGGLLTETQYIDMSRPPLVLTKNHQATVVMSLDLDRNALKKLIRSLEVEKQSGAKESLSGPSKLNALLSEYHESFRLLKQHSLALKKNPSDAKLIDQFLTIFSP